jgi:hypothetical protein
VSLFRLFPSSTSYFNIRLRYDAVERPEKGSGIPPPDTWESHDVYQWLLALAKSIQDGREVAGNVDLFEQGFDR